MSTQNGIGEPDSQSLDYFDLSGIGSTTTEVNPSVNGKHSLSFTTTRFYGADTVTVRLTIDELAAAIIKMEEYVNESQ